MAPIQHTNVDAYIKRFPAGTQVLLEQMRTTIHEAAPEADPAEARPGPAPVTSRSQSQLDVGCCKRKGFPVGRLFDGPWPIVIIIVVALLLFAAPKLPAMARSLGQSMRIIARLPLAVWRSLVARLGRSRNR